uniref:Cystatin domain-containing protein n=1 Tax=Romanomermis culicivorax TaxID=13658 RepID=A0A915KW36_ROMCU
MRQFSGLAYFILASLIVKSKQASPVEDDLPGGYTDVDLTDPDIYARMENYIRFGVERYDEEQNANSSGGISIRHTFHNVLDASRQIINGEKYKILAYFTRSVKCSKLRRLKRQSSSGVIPCGIPDTYRKCSFDLIVQPANNSAKVENWFCVQVKAFKVIDGGDE